MLHQLTAHALPSLTVLIAALPSAVGQFVSQLLPLLAGLVATVTFQYVKHGVAVLDGAPAFVKQILAVLLASGLTWLGAHLGVAIPTDPHAIDPTTWQAIVASAFSLALYAVWKGNSASATTTSTAVPSTSAPSAPSSTPPAAT